MARVIAVANQKGGVGKTLTISSLASILTEKGYRVLLVNLDPQRNLDMVAGRNIAIKRGDTESLSVLNVLKGECTIRDAIVPSNLGDLVRASSDLSQWVGTPILTREEFEAGTMESVYHLIKTRYETDWQADDIKILHRQIETVRDEYDYIIFDTNPSLQQVTLQALYACDYVLIPAFSESFSRDAIAELWDTIHGLLVFYPERKIQIAGILMTRYVTRSINAKAFVGVFQKIAERMGTILFKTKIRRSISVSEYGATQEDLIRYDKNGNTAQDYMAFTEELIRRLDELEANQNG